MRNDDLYLENEISDGFNQKTKVKITQIYYVSLVVNIIVNMDHGTYLLTKKELFLLAQLR